MEWRDVDELYKVILHRCQIILLIDSKRKNKRYLVDVFNYNPYGTISNKNGCGAKFKHGTVYILPMPKAWRVLKWMPIPSVPAEYKC